MRRVLEPPKAPVPGTVKNPFCSRLMTPEEDRKIRELSWLMTTWHADITDLNLACASVLKLLSFWTAQQYRVTSPEQYRREAYIAVKAMCSASSPPDLDTVKHVSERGRLGRDST